MEATAAVVHAREQRFEMERVEIDEPPADEVLLRVIACGVCHTDLVCRDQWYPVPLSSNEAAEDPESGETLKAILRMAS